MIKITEKGDFDNTEKYLEGLTTDNLASILSQYAELGVNALSNATPVDSGLTSESWYYDLVQRPGYFSIRWCNSHIENGVPIAIILQYGHGTRNGGYVEGRNYIMPAIQPVFDTIEKEITAWLSKS